MSLKDEEEKKCLMAIEGNKEILSFHYGDYKVITDAKGKPVFAGTYWRPMRTERDMDTGECKVYVEYWARAGPEAFLSPATQLLDPRSVKGLLNKYNINCMPCDSGQCVAYARICMDEAPEFIKYKHLGWLEFKGHLRYFSWKLYQDPALPSLLILPDQHENYKPKGDLDVSLSTLMPLIKDAPAAICALAIGFASPIWGLIYDQYPEPNFVINYCGKGSGGKTGLQRLCASLAGNCCSGKGTTMLDFSATPVGFYKQFNRRVGVPLVVNDQSLEDDRHADDDSKKSKIMTLCTGMSKNISSREDPAGLEERHYYVGVIFTSSERTFFDKNMTEGVPGRLLEVRSDDFMATIQPSTISGKERSEAIERCVMQNSGLLMDKFIPYLYKRFITPGKLDELREISRQHANTLADMLEGCENHLIRLSRSVSVLLTGLELANDCFALDLDIDILRDFLIQHIRINSFRHAIEFLAMRTVNTISHKVMVTPLRRNKQLICMENKIVGFILKRDGESTYRLCIERDAFDKIYADGDDTFRLRCQLKKAGLLDCDMNPDNYRHVRRYTIDGKEKACYVILLPGDCQLPASLTVVEATPEKQITKQVKHDTSLLKPETAKELLNSFVVNPAESIEEDPLSDN